MKKNNLNIVKIDKNKTLFNYEKKILIKELILDLKLGYYDFEKKEPQKVKFNLEVDYEDKKPTSDNDIKSIVNYGKLVKLIKKLTKNKIDFDEIIFVLLGSTCGLFLRLLVKYKYKKKIGFLPGV